MARRRNSIAHRFAKMRGLPPSEKALMQRIGHLMDAALNNRQASNPFENARKITTRNIYPPTGILVKKGIKSIKIIWDPTPSNLLLRYEVTFDNITTGERTIVSSFINEVTFKATKGTYIARIVSIGRDRSSSIVKTVQFNAGDEVMQLEGAKNGPLELGTLVQDDIIHLEGYSIYVWGSHVLDKYSVANEVNPNATFRLYRAKGPNAVFNDLEFPLTLVETIEMYAATESASNLDNSARGGLITRPFTPGFDRNGSFETSQAVMFSPIAVDPADIDVPFTYFLQAVNRGIDKDEVNLSLVMWTGSDGQGDNVPGDPFTPDPVYVFPHKNCFHSQIVNFGSDTNNPALDSRSMWAYMPHSLNLIANQSTIAIWYRPDDMNANDMARERTATKTGTNYLFGRVNMSDDRDEDVTNMWDIRIFGIINAGLGGDQHQIFIRYGDKTGSAHLGADWRSTSNLTTGVNNDISNLFPWGGAPTGTAAQNDAWYFLVVCFEGGDFIGGGTSKLRVYLNSATNPAGGAPAMLKIPPSGTDPFEDKIEQDDSTTMGYSIGDLADDGGPGPTTIRNMLNGQYTGSFRVPTFNNFGQYHQIGIWNIALDRLGNGGLDDVGLVDGIVQNSAIDRLFNSGFGTLVNWKRPNGTYIQNENLVHLIQFGAVEQAMSTGFPGRDTGYHLYKGDLNFTGVTPVGRFPETFKYVSPGPADVTNTGDHYTDNTSIADILSPKGTNGTTEFDKCHPGQNL